MAPPAGRPVVGLGICSSRDLTLAQKRGGGHCGGCFALAEPRRWRGVRRPSLSWALTCCARAGEGAGGRAEEAARRGADAAGGCYRGAAARGDGFFPPRPCAYRFASLPLRPMHDNLQARVHASASYRWRGSAKIWRKKMLSAEPRWRLERWVDARHICGLLFLTDNEGS